jgi:hypothetical protein
MSGLQFQCFRRGSAAGTTRTRFLMVLGLCMGVVLIAGPVEAQEGARRTVGLESS